MLDYESVKSLPDGQKLFSEWDINGAITPQQAALLCHVPESWVIGVFIFWLGPIGISDYNFEFFADAGSRWLVWVNQSNQSKIFL